MCDSVEGCQCAQGYTGVDGVDCLNIDECSQDENLCTGGRVCQDTDGSYECNCDTGYELSNDVCQG